MNSRTFSPLQRFWLLLSFFLASPRVSLTLSCMVIFCLMALYLFSPDLNP